MPQRRGIPLMGRVVELEPCAKCGNHPHPMSQGQTWLFGHCGQTFKGKTKDEARKQWNEAQRAAKKVREMKQ